MQLSHRKNYSLEFVSRRRWILIKVYRSRSVRKWKSPVVRGYRWRQPVLSTSAFFIWLYSGTSLEAMVGEFAWYWQRLAPVLEQKIFQFNKSRVWEKSPRGLRASWKGSRKTTRGEKDRRKVGGGRRISDREGKRCEIICPLICLYENLIYENSYLKMR